ncbi:MAG: hypothetical protein KatS3mg002_0603 [Candidatus Woesearchaeota archaeon]|nr:MAG: hypothetical protein KatS3mg002_0603 [Candidatus Woesearchaeota archaeon]
MFDVVIPNSNEEEFIDTALFLGYKEVTFLSEDINYTYVSNRIKVNTAFFCQDVNKIAFARKKFNFVFARADRIFFESKVDYIIDSEMCEGKDSFHYRRTFLNQVHAKLAKDNDICIVFSFKNLLSKNRLQSIQSIGRMFQNAELSRKYNLKTVSFSLAEEPLHMKSRSTLNALLKVLRL